MTDIYKRLEGTWTEIILIATIYIGVFLGGLMLLRYVIGEII
jgi:hypothetical protein